MLSEEIVSYSIGGFIVLGKDLNLGAFKLGLIEFGIAHK
jgi:hypothetical protein